MKQLIYLIAGMLISLSTLTAQSFWSIQYSIGFPHAKTNDFTEHISGRGVNITGAKFISNKLAIGGAAGWNTFTTDVPNGEIILSNNAIYGHQYRYTNTIPVMATAAYHPFNGKGKSINPYGLIGVGGIFQEQLIEIGTSSIYSDGWMFGVAPEIGLAIDLQSEFNLIANYKYVFGVETSQVAQLTYSSINIGISKSF